MLAWVPQPIIPMRTARSSMDSSFLLVAQRRFWAYNVPEYVERNTTGVKVPDKRKEWHE